jgi:fructose-1,6-bisphosphatase/inositol monophosphatase family enzyme
LQQGPYDGLIIKMKKIDIEDIAAGYYIMKQAGVHMRTLTGGEFDYKKHGEGLIALGADVSEKVLESIGGG